MQCEVLLSSLREVLEQPSLLLSQLLHDGDDGVRGDRKADADVARLPRVGVDGGVHADDLAAHVLTRNRVLALLHRGRSVEHAEPTPAAVEIAVTGLLNNPDRRRELATAAVTRSHQYSWDESLAAHRAAWARAASRL